MSVRRAKVRARHSRWWIAAAGVALVAVVLVASRGASPPPEVAPAAQLTTAPTRRATEAASIEDRELPTSAVAPELPPLRRLRVSADNAIPVPEDMVGLPGESHLWTTPLLEPEPPTYTQNDPDWTLEEWNDPDFFAGREPEQE